MIQPLSITWAGLYDQVARLAGSLKACGFAGDRVAGFLPNMLEALDHDAGIRELQEE